MSNVEQKLQAMGLKLPACPAPVAAYLPVQTAGKLIYASGQTAWVDGSCSTPAKSAGTSASPTPMSRPSSARSTA